MPKRIARPATYWNGWQMDNREAVNRLRLWLDLTRRSKSRHAVALERAIAEENQLLNMIRELEAKDGCKSDGEDAKVAS